MNKPTKANLLISLQSFSIVFVTFFALAFACNDDTKNNSRTNNQPNSTTKTIEGGCSTETDFRAAITESYLKQYKSDNKNVKKPETNFQSLTINAPVTKRVLVNNKLVDVYPAYPLKSSYTLRTFDPTTNFPSKLYLNEYDYQNVTYFCYKNPKDDYANTKDSCVCLSEGRESYNPTKRRCEYVEAEPSQGCPSN